MKSNRSGGRPLSLAGPAVVIACGGIVGLCLWLAAGAGARALLVLPALGLTVIPGMFWRSRVRAAKWNAVLEDHAAREMARTRQLPSWK